MSKSAKSKSRSPRAISLDDPEGNGSKRSKGETSAGTSKQAAKRKPKSFASTAKLTQVPDEAAQRLISQSTADVELANDLTPPPHPGLVKKRFSWGRLFWMAATGLIALSFGLWVDELIAALFARNDWLGWAAVGLVGLLVGASLALALRELWGLSRMARIDQLKKQAASAIANDDMKTAKQVADQIVSLYSNRPDTARGRNKVSQHIQQIIDGGDLVRLIERDLMVTLDKQAKALVMGSAKRVSVVTAISPRALVDVGYVLFENLKLIRNIADLYGGRPGSLGFWRLTRNVVGHLAVTGTIAVGEGLVQQLVGHGVAAKLSSRLGEGVVNGMLTARIGIAAIDLCRPLPFSEQSRPSVSDFLGELIKLGGSSKKPTAN